MKVELRERDESDDVCVCYLRAAGGWAEVQTEHLDTAPPQEEESPSTHPLTEENP